MTDRLPVAPARMSRGRVLSRQRGMSFLSLVLIAIVVAVSGVVVARVVPSALEYQAVVKAVEKAAAEGNSPEDIRAIFDRYASVNDISSIKGRDLEVIRAAGERPLVRFAYQREFPLAGPAYLTLKYSGQAGNTAAAAGARRAP